MLVRHEIVRVVRTGAVIAEAAEDLAGQAASSDAKLAWYKDKIDEQMSNPPIKPLEG